MTLEGYQFVGASYHPDDIRYGNTDSFQYLLERQRNQRILQGVLRLFELQVDYAKSQIQSPTYTLLVHRDTLTALALALVLRCCQTRDVLYSKLTTHAQRYWSLYGNDFWAAVPLYDDDPEYSPDEGFAGVAGSLAFELVKHEDTGAGLYPSDLILHMLDYIWAEAGTTAETTPAQKQQDFWTLLGAEVIPFDTYQKVFTYMYQAPLDTLVPELQTIVIQMRRDLITTTDWALLKIRWILGEISDDLIKAVKAVQTFINSDVDFRTDMQIESLDVSLIDTFNNNVLQSFAPAGAPLFYVALAVEALIKIAKEITNTPELHTLTFQQFLGIGDYQQLRRTWALNFATAYDAMGTLALFGTLYEVKGLTYRFFLCALQMIEGDEPIPATGETRLTV